MLVRVLKGHFNGFGETYAKAVGDEYDHPSPKHLITRGKLEAVDGGNRPGGRLQGTGKGARGIAKGDGAKHAQPGAKAGGGAGAAKVGGKRATANRRTGGVRGGRKATDTKAKV